MKKAEFERVFTSTIESCTLTLINREQSYSSGKDRLHNFGSAAKLNESTSELALWGMVSKHIIALKDALKRQDIQNIPSTNWDEWTKDIINYMILLRAILTEKGYLE
jgi:hypothetical protein